MLWGEAFVTHKSFTRAFPLPFSTTTVPQDLMDVSVSNLPSLWQPSPRQSSCSSCLQSGSADGSSTNGCNHERYEGLGLWTEETQALTGRPLVELCVEPAGLCGRCTGVAVPLRVVQDQVISKCSRTKTSSPPSQRMIPPRAGLLHSSLSSGMASPIRQQGQETMGMLSPIPCRQQGIFSFRPSFPTPSQLGHNPLGSLSSIDQHMGMPKAAPAGVPLPRLYPSTLGGC